MTIETTVNDAPTGAVGQMEQERAAGAPVAGAAVAAPTFTAEQQAHIDRLVSDRLKREREKQQAAIDKAKADAEAKALADQGEYKALYEKAQAEAQANADRLAQVERDQLRRDAAQAAGIPQLWQRLQGETAEALAEDAKGLAGLMKAVTTDRPATKPTPPGQSPGATNYVQQAIERQQKRATENDPYAAMMKR